MSDIFASITDDSGSEMCSLSKTAGRELSQLT